MGSRRHPALTKFARSNHAREISVSRQINAPPAFLYGESEIYTLTIPLTQKLLKESRGNFSRKVSFGASPHLTDKPKFETINPTKKGENI